MAILFIFLFSVDFARKETVRGKLRVDGAEAKLYALEPGIITRVMVQDEQLVSAGDAIAEISSERYLSTGGALSDATMQQLERERTTLERRKSAIEAASSLSIRAAEQRQSDAERQERELRDQLAVVMRRLEIARNRADDARQFLAEQLIAEPQLNERLEAAASLEQSVLQNKAQVNEAVAAQSRAELEKRQVGANLDRDIAEIDQRLEQINAQIQRTGANTAHVIRAPIDGKITGLQARAGEHASSDIPLGIVLPEDSFLIAEVYLPSRAIGFVETGQTVKLQYDAFPYQKFGVALGEVSSIANTSLLPQELSVTSQTGEPVYRVSIAISDQNIKVFSRNVPLHAGMEFTAVVVLENRRLLEWLLEPLARK
ncbi:MAG: HlyD family efflux transporter periplasmic adaptor subunit [Pseudomonadota bacterium]